MYLVFRRRHGSSLSSYCVVDKGPLYRREQCILSCHLLAVGRQSASVLVWLQLVKVVPDFHQLDGSNAHCRSRTDMRSTEFGSFHCRTPRVFKRSLATMILQNFLSPLESLYSPSSTAGSNRPVLPPHHTRFALSLIDIY